MSHTLRAPPPAKESVLELLLVCKQDILALNFEHKRGRELFRSKQPKTGKKVTE